VTRPLGRVPKRRLAQLAASEQLAICLDVDGTLATLVPRPWEARVPPDTRAILRRLRRHRSVTLIIVSGRGADDARRVVGTRVDWTVANHGFELAEGDRAPQPFASRGGRRAVRRAAARVATAIGGLAGVRLEDKGWTLSVHYREAPALGNVLWSRVNRAVRGLDVRVYGGKRVIEVRPAGTWTKGSALQRLLTRLYGRLWRASTGVFFAGDDETDEHVFATLGRDALTVKVGSGTTRAQYRTRSPASFARWLERFETLIP
jgi:trehalose-phosphatase